MSKGYTPTGPMVNAFGGAFGAGAGYAANSPLTGGSAIKKAKGKPGTLKPPAAAKPKPPRPWDLDIQAQYNAATTPLQTAWQNAQGDYTYDTATGANGYGFNLKGALDAAGNPTGNYSVDPSDPFSKMTLLQRSYENSKRGTTNNYAASGQLYSGSLRNAQKYNSDNLTQGKDALMKDFSQFLMDATRRKRQAGNDLYAGTSQAAANALSAQIGRGA